MRIKRHSKLVSLAAALGFIGLLSPAALEADFIYTYTGQAFSVDESFGGQFPSDVTNISGWFDVGSALSPSATYNLSPVGDGGTVIAYDFTDGFLNIDSGLGPFSVTTDAGGNIVGWNIDIALSDDAERLMTCTSCSYIGGAEDSSAVFNYYEAWILNSPGAWTAFDPVSDVPEPGSLGLIGGGFFGLVLLGSFRKRVFGGLSGTIWRP